jgi:CheY-like chemotaxis protein
MSSESAPSASSDAMMPQPPKHPILIVDDELPILAMLRDVLVDEGFTVVTANNGPAALYLLQQTTVSLVLTDFMMPNLDGIQLAELLRGDPRTADVPLILMSAVPPPEVGAQFVAVLAKPFALDNVVQLVRQYHSG